MSYAAYEPQLGRNNLIGDPGILDFYLFSWPTSPSWLYALTQGLHVTIGIALVPIVLVKLWSAMPKLFEWPPLRSPAHALERASLALLVSSTLFQFATGSSATSPRLRWRPTPSRGSSRADSRGTWCCGSPGPCCCTTRSRFRSTRRCTGWRCGRAGRAINHVRVPALLSALTLIVSFPLILGFGDGRYERATTLSQDVYLGWLLLCAAMFAISGLLYALRARRRQPS